MKVSGTELATWLVHRAEQTSSPNVLESELKSIKCFRLAAKRLVKNFYIAEANLTGYLKKLEAKPRLRLGLEREVVQILIQNALSENGNESFVGIRQAAIYALMYYITARFEEVKELELRQVHKKGASLEISILKGKKNQTRKLQRCIIHPNTLHHKGKMCPVDLIDSYLVH